MRILAIETSGRTGSVALAELEPRLRVAERIFPSKMTLNQTLAAHVREVCGDAPLAEMALDGVAVGIGPGSYTGVRMGVALAKALAHALELPLAGISAPEAMAAALPARPGAGICVLQEARADEVYTTALRKQDDLQATELAPTRVLRIEEALAAARDLLGGPPDVFCGNAAGTHAGQVQAFYGTARMAHRRYDTPRAGVMAEMAVARLGDADPEVAFTLRPRYARVSQAERQHGIDLQLA